MSIRSWIHSNRAKHHRHMSLAHSYVEHSNYLVRQGDPVKGWHYLSLAIGEVVVCGCDRSLWRPKVREAIEAEKSA